MIRALLVSLVAAALCGFAQTDDRPELWGGLKLGMTPAEATATIMAKPGAQNARLGRPGRDGRSSMQVTARYDAFQVGGERAELRPVFHNGGLESVRLILRPGTSGSAGFGGTFCAGSALAILDRLNSLLATKYEPVPGVRPAAFTNGLIQVSAEASEAAAPSPMYTNYCISREQSGELAYVTLTYEGKATADARAAAQNDADRQRQEDLLRGL